MAVHRWGLLVFAALGCGASTPLTGQTAATVPCDPIAAAPISLGAIVGVGQEASGTLYVDAQNGIFVSSGGLLFRQHVTGTGQSGSDQFIFTITTRSRDGGTSSVDLLVQTSGTTAVAMALGPGGARTFLDQAGDGITPLTLAPESAVSAMPVINTPNVISDVADVENGDVLLITVPMDAIPNAANGGRSLFYGPPDAVAQRTITSVQQTRSGNGTLTFLVGAVTYTLAWGLVPGPDAGPLGVSSLESLTPQGGAPLSLTERSPTPTLTPAGLTVTCPR
jgi:hypothetical protein